MDFEFSDEQEMLRATVRRFLHERAPSSWVRSMLDDPRGTTDDVWHGLAELGVIGTLVPEEHGGTGGGMVDAGVVLEELGRAVHPGPFLSSAVGAVSAIVAVASPAEQTELLPGLATGARTGTLALLEPGRRIERRDPTTRAKPVGDHWLLSGTKAWVADADAADLLLVTAAADDGVGVFTVDRGAENLDVRPAPTVDGTTRWADVALADVTARRLGSGDASVLLATVVDRILIALVVDGVGAAGRVLELAVDHAKQRVQFDRPIGSFQAVQHLCADMLHDLELARAGAYYGLWAADAASSEELHRAATMAKAWSSDALVGVGASAIQVFGGVGFTWEHDAHLFYKRLLTLQHAYGGTADHLEELARLVIS